MGALDPVAVQIDELAWLSLDNSADGPKIAEIVRQLKVQAGGGDGDWDGVMMMVVGEVWWRSCVVMKYIFFFKYYTSAKWGRGHHPLIRHDHRHTSQSYTMTIATPDQRQRYRSG